jgi:hypothetical protein
MAIVKASEAAAKKAATAQKAATIVKATATKTAEKLTTIIKAASRRSEATAFKADVTGTAVPPAAPGKVALPAKAKKAPVVGGVVVSPNKGKTAVTPAAVPATATAVPATPVVKTPKTPKAPKVSPRTLIVDLLLLRNMTDEEIHAKVVAKYGEGLYTTTRSYVQLTRSDLNAGLIKKPIVEGKLTAHIGKVIIDDKGNHVEQPYKPSNLRKAELVFDVV